MEEAWFWGVRVGFGGREGALTSALIIVKNIYLYLLPDGMQKRAEYIIIHRVRISDYGFLAIL